MEDVFVTEQVGDDSMSGSSDEGSLETADRRANRCGYEMHLDAVSPYRHMFPECLGVEPTGRRPTSQTPVESTAVEPTDQRVESVDSSSSEDEESRAASAADANEQLNVEQLSTMFDGLVWQEVEKIGTETPNLEERMKQLCAETRRRAAELETGETPAASSRASSVGSRTVRGQPIQSEVAFRQQIQQIAKEKTGEPAPSELPVEATNDLDPHQRATLSLDMMD